jgi:hypothetical protein
MSNLSASDMRFLDQVLLMQSGYCLDFSDRTFADFFTDVLNLNIDEPKFFEQGGSKGKRMRYFLRTAADQAVAKLLSALWEYRTDWQLSGGLEADLPGVTERYAGIVERLRTTSRIPTDALDRFTPDETLEELIAGIKRDVDAGKPETALDRLHTYCMKKFAYLVANSEPPAEPASTLNARVAQYLGRARKNAKTHHPVSFKIMTSAVEAFELFNNVRNDHSLAHDNSLIERAEARFIFNAIVNFLRFIKATEGQKFGP